MRKITKKNIAYLAVSLAVYIMAVVAYASWSHNREKQIIYKEIDDRLLLAAKGLKYMLATDFHDRAVGPNSISKDEELKNRRAISDYAGETGFVYVYTLVQKDGRFYFSAPTVTPEEEKERASWYFYPYEDLPEGFVTAFQTSTTQYLSYTDQWGTFRSVALPQNSPTGKTYLACADYDISYVQGLLRKNLLVSIGTSLFFLLLSGPFLLTNRLIWRESARRISESEENYRELVENANSIILRLDSQGRITFFNEFAEKFFGYPKDEIIGRHPLGLIIPEVDSFGRNMTTLIQDINKTPEKYLDTDNENIRKDGSRVWVHWTNKAMLDKNDNLVGLLCIGQDIGTRKALEMNLLQARKAADAANKAKSIFISNMSHEIRTPMTAVLGYAQILQRDPKITADQMESLRIIDQSGRHLLSIINEILEMSKIEAGRVELTSEEFDIHALLSEVEEMFRIPASQKNIRLEVSFAKEMPQYLYADSGKVRQVLINLLNNALKFTDAGHIKVRAHSPGPVLDSELKLIHIEIEDTGRGVTQQDMEQIFKPFGRGANVRTSDQGTGLGLPISRKYARLMKGDVTFNSIEGQGSIFTFTFQARLVTPVMTRTSETQTAQQVVGLKQGQTVPRVLVVDDQVDNRELLRDILHGVGFEVREASNGRMALEIFQNWNPNVVLMDWRMPDMDGMEALRAIKNLPAGRTIPVVMVTASVFQEGREQAMEAGADGFVRKPFNSSGILEEVKRVLNIAYAYAVPQASIDKPPSSPVKESLELLHPEVRSQLLEALEVGDITQVKNVIEQEVLPTHPTLGIRLQQLVQEYAIESIVQLLKE